MSHLMSEGMPIISIKVALIALGGVLFTAILGFFASRLAKRTHDQELFQNALTFVTGQTQNRSVGIALLRSYGDAHPEKQGIIQEIFRAQMMHLLDEGYGSDDHGLRRIERYNYLLMKDVLSRWMHGTGDNSAKGYFDRESPTTL